MDEYAWTSVFLIVVTILMMLPSIIDRARKNKIRRNKR